MTTSIYVAWVVVMNFKIGSWAAIGKVQIHGDFGEIDDGEDTVTSPSDPI